MARRHRWVLGLLAFCPPAWAAYRDGFFGLVVLSIALPVALVVLVLAVLLRQAGCFERAVGRRLFALPVGAAWIVLLCWALRLGDGLSVVLVGGGVGLLSAVATGPAWWRPGAWASTPGRMPARRWLAAYWAGTALGPMLEAAPLLLRAGWPLDALPWSWLSLWLMFACPRWVGATLLMRSSRGAHAWFALALLAAALGATGNFAEGVPPSVIALSGGLLALDLLVWVLGVRASISSEKV